MAISTIKISDTMNWAKKMMFNRNSAIGNSLEPALTSANLIAQVILGPPFDWWWNVQEIAFTANPVVYSAPISGNISITDGIIVIPSVNTFAQSAAILIGGLTGTLAFLNGQILVNLAASPTQVTSQINFANLAPTVAAGTPVLTAATTQDYTVFAPQFSHIEHASVLDITKTPAKWIELKVQNNLSLDTISARPLYIGPEVEDGNGNVTFRLMPAPSDPYPVSIHAMNVPPNFTSVNQTWSPMPDFMQWIYSWGFLSLMWLFADDARFGMANQKFTSGLLARAEGITEEERNIFLNNWNEMTGNQMVKMQQGNQARQT
jgi:hypothetical protein